LRGRRSWRGRGAPCPPCGRLPSPLPSSTRLSHRRGLACSSTPFRTFVVCPPSPPGLRWRTSLTPSSRRPCSNRPAVRSWRCSSLSGGWPGTRWGEETMAADLGLSGIGKAWSGRPVLNGLDLTVAAGEVVAVLGPSGAGKTTLLLIVAGLEVPDEGR